MNFLQHDREVHASLNPMMQCVDLYFFVLDGYEAARNGPIRKFLKVQETAVAEYERVESPSLSLSSQSAQRLMDQLWNCGFRPTEGSGSAGALAATQKHLDDMRQIAFTALDIDVKKAS